MYRNTDDEHKAMELLVHWLGAIVETVFSNEVYNFGRSLVQVYLAESLVFIIISHRMKPWPYCFVGFTVPTTCVKTGTDSGGLFVL